MRAGLGGQFIFERAKSSMMACALRLIGFQTQQSIQSIRNAPIELDRCHTCRSHVPMLPLDGMFETYMDHMHKK